VLHPGSGNCQPQLVSIVRLISVVVVNWNRKELLRACLASVARQGGVEFETIVVDNGSTDGSAELAEGEFGALVIRNAQNRGFCVANNQGIRWCGTTGVRPWGKARGSAWN
jgi:glycosyltransferase involved in cell wall biosynthesis